MTVSLSSLAVGCKAPDIRLAAGSHSRLSDLRGSPIVLIIEAPHWDPTRDEITARLAALHQVSDGVQVLRASGDETAAAFGTGDHDAAFVIDPEGFIRWRYVAGVDALAAVTAPATTTFDPDAPLGDERGSWSRRGFVQVAMTFAAALALPRVIVPGDSWAAEPIIKPAAPRPVTLHVNGRDVALSLEPRVTLLDALRNYAGLTGTKKGCDHGQCGACTVHIDGRRELSCMTFAIMQEGRDITTIEGIAHGDTLDPMQQAFITHDGFQCGYCTSGQIMSATAVVKEPWGPADSDVREAMSGNICRCGAYPGIVAAVQSVRNRAGGPR
jgi:xanthine dehydrogenase YagT iron-sulfur-binding subunit